MNTAPMEGQQTETVNKLHRDCLEASSSDPFFGLHLN